MARQVYTTFRHSLFLDIVTAVVVRETEAIALSFGINVFGYLFTPCDIVCSLILIAEVHCYFLMGRLSNKNSSGSYVICSTRLRIKHLPSHGSDNRLLRTPVIACRLHLAFDRPLIASDKSGTMSFQLAVSKLSVPFYYYNGASSLLRIGLRCIDTSNI